MITTVEGTGTLIKSGPVLSGYDQRSTQSNWTDFLAGSYSIAPTLHSWRRDMVRWVREERRA